MIIDISRKLSNGMETYPGNPSYSMRVLRKYEKLNSIGREGSQLSEFSSGTHNGTHVDGPSHCGLSKGVEEWSLDCFYGECRVLELGGMKEITAECLKKQEIKKGERILLKTDNSKSEEFKEDFTFVNAEAARFLAERGVKLLGTDGLSIQKKGSQSQEVHKILLEKMPVMEGLMLRNVRAGRYTLSAFPLSMEGDGALARAVLIE